MDENTNQFNQFGESEPAAPLTPTPLMPKKSSVPLIIKIVVGVVVLIVAGMGIVLGTRVWDPLWNPFRPEPEEIIEKMTEKMKELKTSHSKSEISLNVKEDSTQSFNVSINISGDTDDTDPDNPKTTSDFNMVIDFEGMQFSLAGQSKTISETSYLKLTTIPIALQPIFALLGIDLNELKDQWIELDEDSIKNLLGESWTPEMEEEAEKEREQTEQMGQAISALFEDKKLYILKEELPDEKIGNQKVYHYVVSLNNEEIKKIIPELLKMSEVLGGTDMLISETNEEKLTKSIDEFFNKVGEITGELWIGKKDNYLYKIGGEKEFDLSKFGGGETGKITIKINVELSNFNKPIQIGPPESHKTLEEILSIMLSESPFLEAQKNARDARRMADLSQIRIAMEMHYLDNNQYPKSTTLPAQIGDYMVDVPTDPGTGPCPTYNWISNTKNAQKYCIWACLEDGSFYAISHRGIKELYSPPTVLDCWTEAAPEVHSPGQKEAGFSIFEASLIETLSKIFNK